MKSKIAAFILLIVAMLGLGASPALAASSDQTCQTFVADDNTIEKQVCVSTNAKKSELARWGYCSVSLPIDKISFYDLQGWCGDSVAMNRPSAGQCRYMGVWDNWSGSMGNNTDYPVTLWQSGSCSGTQLYVGGHIFEADLYPYGLGNAVSTIARPAV